MTTHTHYWKAIGEKGSTWKKSHALGRCIRKGCEAWTVLGYGEGTGPCSHNTVREEGELPAEVFLSQPGYKISHEDLAIMNEYGEEF